MFIIYTVYIHLTRVFYMARSDILFGSGGDGDGGLCAVYIIIVVIYT